MKAIWKFCEILEKIYFFDIFYYYEEERERERERIFYYINLSYIKFLQILKLINFYKSVGT